MGLRRLQIGSVRRGVHGGWLMEAGSQWVDHIGDGMGWVAKSTNYDASATRRQGQFWVEAHFAQQVCDTEFEWEDVDRDLTKCYVTLPVQYEESP